MTRATLHVVPGRRRLAVTYRTARSHGPDEEALRCHLLLLHHPREFCDDILLVAIMQKRRRRSEECRSMGALERKNRKSDLLTYLLKELCSVNIKIRRFNVLLTRGFAFHASI